MCFTSVDTWTKLNMVAPSTKNGNSLRREAAPDLAAFGEHPHASAKASMSELDLLNFNLSGFADSKLFMAVG